MSATDEPRRPWPELAAWLASWTWPVSKEQVLARADQRGWTVTSNRPGKGARWRVADDLPEASASVLDGVLAALTVRTTPCFGDDAEGRRRLQDAFAAQVREVSGELGAPTDRRPGRDPATTWVLGNGSALKVCAAAGCFWVLTSPEFVEIERDLGERS